MNDSSEATHYQIELTSRQVLAGLVVLVVCLFAAFFAGVYIGRNAEASSAASELASVDEVARGGQRYDFFSKTDGSEAEGGGTRTAPGDDDASVSDFPAAEASRPLDAGELGPDPDDEELAPTEGDQAAMAGADPDALFEDDADLPPPEEMGRGGRRRRAAARAAGEEARDTPAESEPAAATGTERGAKAPSTGGAAAPTVPAAAAAPTTAARAASSEEQGFHIQVLATSDRAKAEALVARLVGADFKAFIVPSNEGGRTTYRVRVGPFQDRAIAAGKAKELETRWGLDSWISPGSP